MKIFKRIMFALMILIIPFSLIGCTPKEIKQLSANTWVYDDINMVFMTEDGKSNTSIAFSTLGPQIEELSDGEITQEEYETGISYLSIILFKFNDDYSFDIGFDLTNTELYKDYGLKSIYVSDFISILNNNASVKLKKYLSFTVEDNKINFDFDGCMKALKEAYDDMIEQGSTEIIPTEYEELLNNFDSNYFLTIAEKIKNIDFKYELKEGKSFKVSYTITIQQAVDLVVFLSEGKVTEDDLSILTSLYDNVCFELVFKAK